MVISSRQYCLLVCTLMMLSLIFVPIVVGMSDEVEITFIEFWAQDSMNMGSIANSPY